ncbi:Ig-like domain-containing protein [Flocculibacter collagenilyticus]|uniref:Ig-like domain-containing protein n=1 Tax=Flocculibacter collagenilyticus TaxID=2744479 RepID=UPI0018F51C8A|nr:Ig-like domain-containing protein [Flocculibacter collagenilyticus]
MQMIRLFGAIFISMILAACGGGGSLSKDNNNGGGTTGNETFVLSVTATGVTSGDESRVVSFDDPVQISVKVTNQSGAVQSGKVVSFSVEDGTLFSFSKENLKAITDADGVATIQVSPTTVSGAATVTISLSTGEQTTIGLESLGDFPVGNIAIGEVNLLADKLQLNTGINDKIELTVLVKDINNNLLANQNVSFSANNDAEILVTQASTDDSGQATAILTTKNNPQNRTITVSATVGTTSSSLIVDVVGTGIDVNAQSSAVLDDVITVTTLVTTSEGIPLSGVPLVITSKNGNAINNATPVTNSAGQATISYTGTNSGQDILTVSGLGVSSTITIDVQSDVFTFVNAKGKELELNKSSMITLNWLKDGEPVEGESISFTSTRGTVTNVKSTDEDGNVEISLSSTTSGPALVRAVAQGSNEMELVTQVEVEFVAVDVDSINVQLSPASIGPSGETSTVTAIVRDNEGNLVKNKTINFSVDDVSGGSLSPASDTTDSQGIASSVYTSNSISANNGVTITATESVSNKSDSASITVADRALFFRFGTSSVIKVENEETTYLQDYVVFASDADGNAIANQELTVSFVPISYELGAWCQKNKDGEFDSYLPLSAPGNEFPSEDVNRNGILDAGEDANNDGFITPGTPWTISSKVITNEQGAALIELRYPKQYGVWVKGDLSVSGKVSGSESVSTREVQLTYLVDDAKKEGAPPPENPLGDGGLECPDPNTL